MTPQKGWQAPELDPAHYSITGLFGKLGEILSHSCSIYRVHWGLFKFLKRESIFPLPRATLLRSFCPTDTSQTHTKTSGYGFHHLCRRPLQNWFTRNINSSSEPQWRKLSVQRVIIRDLLWWISESLLKGIPLAQKGAVPHTMETGQRATHIIAPRGGSPSHKACLPYSGIILSPDHLANLTVEGVLHKVEQFITASHKPTMIRSYSYKWKHFVH